MTATAQKMTFFCLESSSDEWQPDDELGDSYDVRSLRAVPVIGSRATFKQSRRLQRQTPSVAEGDKEVEGEEDSPVSTSRGRGENRGSRGRGQSP